MGGQVDSARAIADEIIDALREVQVADGSVLGNAVCEICRRADHYRRNKRWADARDCCNRGQRIARKLRSSTGTAVFRFTDGFLRMQLGAISVSQGELTQARNWFQEAAKLFRGCNRHHCEGVAWMAVGEASALAKDWELAITGFENSLTALNALWSTHSITGELRECVRNRLSETQSGLVSSIRKTPPVDGAEDPDSPLPVRLRIPILGTVGAGTGHIAKQNIEGYLELGQEHARGAKFALRVEGHSMIEEGILEGDLALIRESARVDSGTIAAIVVPESLPEGTLKRYFREKDHHRLEPANDDEPTLLVIPERTTTTPDDRDLDQGQRRVERIVKSYNRTGKTVKTYSGEIRIVGKLVGVFRQLD